MNDRGQVVVRHISGVEMTPDGEFLLVRDGTATAALHRAVFNDLLIALPNAIEQSQRLGQHRGEQWLTLNYQGWEVGRLDGTSNLIVRFRLLGNAALSFCVPCDQVPDLLQALNAAAGLTGVPAVSGQTLQ